jgi:hypothetical protein
LQMTRRRVEWETAETWDRGVLEDGHIRDCILSNAQQFMRGAGLSFVAGRKRNPRTSIVGRYGARSSTRTKSTRWPFDFNGNTTGASIARQVIALFASVAFHFFSTYQQLFPHVPRPPFVCESSDLPNVSILEYSTSFVAFFVNRNGR